MFTLLNSSNPGKECRGNVKKKSVTATTSSLHTNVYHFSNKNINYFKCCLIVTLVISGTNRYIITSHICFIRICNFDWQISHQSDAPDQLILFGLVSICKYLFINIRKLSEYWSSYQQLAKILVQTADNNGKAFQKHILFHIKM